ncbi:hypothetical protein PI124_g21101 [Phytophthora idaei]|nr:hypothetical protein PI125_g21906 [Phytophthora idaei]KAG3129964.1 hypothetical protein PI126_g20710 [Phytophthora idaei]KAG3233833.1 hypothetical protein PI124_g21101 [Phytophthora idaei]
MALANILIEDDWEHDQWDPFLANEEEGGVETARSMDLTRVCIDIFASNSGLHLRKRNKIKQAYNAHGGRGFYVFVTETFEHMWRDWTNEALKAKGEPSTIEAQLDAYLGLEMAMSLAPITDIKEFWFEKIFLGHRGFEATMRRNRFQEIHNSFNIHPPLDANEDMSESENETDSDNQDVPPVSDYRGIYPNCWRDDRIN